MGWVLGRAGDRLALEAKHTQTCEWEEDGSLRKDGYDGGDGLRRTDRGNEPCSLFLSLLPLLTSFRFVPSPSFVPRDEIARATKEVFSLLQAHHFGTHSKSWRQ